MAGQPTRHQIEWAASGLRRAALDAGVEVPLDYARRVAADGLAFTAELGVTRLGAGVVIHTQPASNRELPIVVGYTDARGQWYRDGHRHTPALEGQPAAEATQEVGL